MRIKRNEKKAALCELRREHQYREAHLRVGPDLVCGEVKSLEDDYHSMKRSG